MSFYPLFNILDAEGFVNLANFSPNNWEIKKSGDKNIFAFWIEDGRWTSNNAGKLAEGQFKEFKTSDFIKNKDPELVDGVFTSDLVFLQLRSDIIDENSGAIPDDHSKSTAWPEWRATIGFRRQDSQVSYQGEITPTPGKATLLTFHPFIQYDETDNFLVFVNMEKSSEDRWSNLYILNGTTKDQVATLKVRNNAVNVIPLNSYEFKPDELPVFYCDAMAGIPFGFARGRTTSMLSLEHTHPPGSLTLFGNRFLSQKYIKTEWTKLFNTGK